MPPPIVAAIIGATVMLLVQTAGLLIYAGVVVQTLRDHDRRLGELEKEKVSRRECRTYHMKEEMSI